MVFLTCAIVASNAGGAQAQDAQITGHADASTARYGVVGWSAVFDGVFGESEGAASADNGVFGTTDSTFTADAGIRGTNSGIGPGLYGSGTATDTGYGVRAWSGDAHALHADSGSTKSYHYGGYFTGPNGLYAQAEIAGSTAIRAMCSLGSTCLGIYGYSNDYHAMFAITDDTSDNYGLYTPDNVYSLNYHTTSGLSLIVQNVPDSVLGAAALEPGEVVALNGIAAPPPGMDRPVVQVTRADWTASGGLLGVVETAYEITMVKRPKVTFVEQEFANPEGGEPDVLWMPQVDEDHEVPVHDAVDGPVPPGGYAVVRVLGLVQVKAAALAGQVLPGDALRLASIGGAAVLGNHVGVEGAPVVAHALEALPAGTEGLVWAVVGTP
jgi:hypothetical protein